MNNFYFILSGISKMTVMLSFFFLCCWPTAYVHICLSFIIKISIFNLRHKYLHVFYMCTYKNVEAFVGHSFSLWYNIVSYVFRMTAFSNPLHHQSWTWMNKEDACLFTFLTWNSQVSEIAYSEELSCIENKNIFAWVWYVNDKWYWKMNVFNLCKCMRVFIQTQGFLPETITCPFYMLPWIYENWLWNVTTQMRRGKAVSKGKKISLKPKQFIFFYVNIKES